MTVELFAVWQSCGGICPQCDGGERLVQLRQSPEDRLQLKQDASKLVRIRMTMCQWGAIALIASTGLEFDNGFAYRCLVFLLNFKPAFAHLPFHSLLVSLCGRHAISM